MSDTLDPIGPINSEGYSTRLKNIISADNVPKASANDIEKAEEIRHQTERVNKKHWYDAFVRLFYWYPSNLPKEEKLLLFKLDAILLLYVCSSYFTKALDKSNITKAYVTGMKEDIDFGGDNLADAKSIYSAGYIIAMCLGIMLLTRPWARLSLPILETIWGVLTFCEAAAKNRRDMLALRFLIGFCEGPIFPTVMYTLGSWYKRDEIYRRVMCFSISSSIGGIFSGALQTAAFKNLGGKGGLTGWQWGFIVDGIFTVPIALIGFFFYPGTREQSGKVWWLTEKERELSHKRMEESGVRPVALKIDLSILKRTFFRWHVHYFTAFWVLLNVLALPDGMGFDLWLNANKVDPKTGEGMYNQTQVLNYPSIQSAVGITSQFLMAGLSDSFPPYIFLTITQLLFIVSYSSLTYWDIPTGWRWVCFLIIGIVSTNQAIISGMINRTCRRDGEERAFVLGFSDAVSQAMNIWTNIVFMPTSDAPRFHKGYIVSLVAAVIMLLLPIINFFGDRYDIKKYAVLDNEYAEEAGITDAASEKSQSKVDANVYAESVSASSSSNGTTSPTSGSQQEPVPAEKTQ